MDRYAIEWSKEENGKLIFICCFDHNRKDEDDSPLLFAMWDGDNTAQFIEEKDYINFSSWKRAIERYLRNKINWKQLKEIGRLTFA